MDEKKVLTFLRSPAAAPVDLALELANLTDDEMLAIDLCGRRGLTRDRAVEELDKIGIQREIDTINRWYRSGMKKLCRVWGGLYWIEAIIEYENNT